MFTASLRKIGGSIILVVPPALLDVLRLRPGARVGLTVEGGCLLVKPESGPRYTLDELLAECDPAAPPPAPDPDWVSGPGEGREAI